MVGITRSNFVHVFLGRALVLDLRMFCIQIQGVCVCLTTSGCNGVSNLQTSPGVRTEQKQIVSCVCLQYIYIFDYVYMYI